MQRLVQTGQAGAATSQDASAGLQARAEALQRAAEQSTSRTAADVERRFDELSAALAEANAELAQLSERARGLAAAEAAAARVAALNAAVGRLGAGAGRDGPRERDGARGLPAAVRRPRRRPARACPGRCSPRSGRSRRATGPTPRRRTPGRRGRCSSCPPPSPPTRVDGDHDGDADIHDPADAIFTAAHYLCANGAGRDEESTARAVWHYNHADWYVALVLKLAGQIAAARRPAAPAYAP